MTFNLAEGKFHKAKGFSLLELLVTIIVIGILVYVSFPHYFQTIENTRAKVIEFQAATFSRTVENLYGQAKIGSKKYVDMNGVTVYMNEKGWPASTSLNASVKSYNQSPVECLQLWNGVFKNAPNAVIFYDDKQTNSYKNAETGIFSINGHICRYELLSGEDERYFFDYDLRTGEVTIHSPH